MMKHMLPFLLCLVAAPCALAQPDPAEVPAPGTEAPLIRTTPELAMTPMQREIQQLLDKEREALRVLRLRFENASGVDEETLRLLRNPEDVRRGLISPADPSTTGQQ
jgi:hypothetical protein